MKFHLLALLAAIALLGFPQPAEAASEITFQDFYDALAPDGEWVEIEEYGYCWRPFVDDQWRPYTDGQWVYTDAGYTWLSDEPWGWATYHYGRWTKVKSWGWVWVPGYEWGPAWVSWRTNDDYIGWAALPPEAVWEPSAGISVFVDVDYGIGPDWYAFCPVTNFCAPRLRTFCLPWRNNITIINSTVNITRIRNVNNGIIFNDGPDITIVNRRAAAPLRRLRLERETNFDVAALREGRLKSRLEGDTLKLPAPQVGKQDGRPLKLAGRAGSSQINRGWESAVKNPELAKAYRDKVREEAERTGRKAHKEFSVQVQDQPPQSQVGVVRNRPENTVPPQSSADAVNPPSSVPQRRRDIQDDAPSQADSQSRQRNEELRNRILEQRQQQNQENQQAEQTRRQRQQEQEQQQQQQSQQQEDAENTRRQNASEARERVLRTQQEFEARREAARQQRQQQQPESASPQSNQSEAAENSRRQQAAEARDQAIRAQQELEARREAAKQQRQQEQQQQQQQQEAARQQEQQRQQQSQMQQQLQQQREQMQQQRQERQQQRQERRQGD